MASTLDKCITSLGLQSIMKCRKKNVKVGIIMNHIAFQELLMHNININKVQQELRNCDTRDPENVEKTRDQSVLSDMSDSDSYSDNNDLPCTTEKQSDENSESEK